MQRDRFLNAAKKVKVNILDIILVLFAVLFVYAAVSKLLTYDEFKVQISKSPLIMRHGWWISWAVPTAEIVISVILFIPRLQMMALYGAFFLMFAFTLYIGFMLVFVPRLPCSCGGILSMMGWKEHFVFNIGFSILAVVGIVLLNRQRRFQALTA
jgi:hypothetical protein